MERNRSNLFKEVNSFKRYSSLRNDTQVSPNPRKQFKSKIFFRSKLMRFVWNFKRELKEFFTIDLKWLFSSQL
jgi:hypothetical protein